MRNDNARNEETEGASAGSEARGRSVSRRGLIAGATLGAAAMGVAGGMGAARAFGADSGSGAADAGSSAAKDATAEAGAADYVNIYADGVNLMPARKATCPGPQGPVAYESRQIDEGEIVRTEEFDLVVVGAGIGGLMATLKAADMGANVLLLEKMTRGRGCFECFGAVGAKCQEGTEIDKTALLDEILRSAYYRTRPEPAVTYVNRSGEATDFWQEMLDKGSNGFKITKVEQTPSTCGFPAMTQLIDSELGFYDSPALPADAGSRSGLSGIYVCLEMQDVAKSAYDNVDMRFSTPAVQLTTDGSGAVTGVIAKDADGYFRVSSKLGVILATGGYDANPRLMEAWTRPEDYATSSWWNPSWGTTGDGHMMGLAVGAQMDSVPQPVMNFRWGTPDSFADARTWNAVYFGILVNGRGRRFVREDLPFQCVSNAQNAQPAYGKNCWYVFDEGMMEGMQDAVEEFEDKGWLYEGATPEELAENVGIDPQGLSATLEEYAAGFEAGADALGRDLTQTMPFTGGKLYAFVSNSNVLATVGGLTIDGNCQVLDTSDRPIPGLWACGNASGNFFAGNYPRHIPGTSIGRAITFGYVAAESAVNGVQGEDPLVDSKAPALASYDPSTADPSAAVADDALGVWDPANPIHGSSPAYTDADIAVATQSCDNCHAYRPGDSTVADGMTFSASADK